jgi:hypothetical protein
LLFSYDICIMRNADADRDRADLNVAIVDVPAFLAGMGRSAAGEGGHALLKRDLSGQAINLRAKRGRSRRIFGCIRTRSAEKKRPAAIRLTGP